MPKNSAIRSFYFLRHGETDWNVEGRSQGQLPGIALNELGRQQAENAAKILHNIAFTHIVSSPLQRAMETTHIINTRNLPVTTHAGFMERNSGSWQGKIKAEIYAMHGRTPPAGPLHGPYDIPLPEDAETYPQMDARVEQALHETFANVAGTFLIVAHGGVFFSLNKILRGQTMQSKNAVPYHFHHTAGGWQLNEIV
ncbi:MAG: histidine phosphatase family protein [Proteobacteria bacterium]|nr:histidine phosphatase family protein [Pseudomonadota bacterium]